MNEHIKRFAEQAGSTHKQSLGVYQFFSYELEKFTELIVRECAEVGHDSVEDGDDIDAIMRRVHNNILKHFGVK